MSAKDQIAAMLNELMGPGRNQDKNLDLNFRDADVCKFYLAGFCPHEEFTNTKADLGSCKYVHDDNLRIAYRKSEFYEKLGYEKQFYNCLVRIQDDMQRKIERNKERLALTQGPQNMDESTKKHLNEKIGRLEKEMAGYVEIAEKAGLKGDLDRSQRYVKRAEEINQELDAVRKLFLPPEYTAGYKDPSAPKPMRICEVCGSFLIIGDCQQRIDDHMQGKQHLGFARVASTIEELKEKFGKETSPVRSRSRSRTKSVERPRHQSSSSHHHRDRTGSHKSDSSHKADKRHDEKHHKR
uniref:Luc7-like protein 3 n=1 Tax=Meloidogyne hapla TaxID=6305 RepID=A0A1I8BPW8_MELHA